MTAESTDQDGQPSYYERVQKILADPADHFQQLSDQVGKEPVIRSSV